MTTEVRLNALIEEMLMPALNREIVLVQLDFRSGASVGRVQAGVAARFVTDEYPALVAIDSDLFSDVLSDWMLKNWTEELYVEILLQSRDCREQLALLHDVAAGFNDAVEKAQFERLRLEQVAGVADAHSRFNLTFLVFE